MHLENITGDPGAVLKRDMNRVVILNVINAKIITNNSV
jgi:hypothetical protein